MKEFPATFFRVSQYRQGEWHYLQRFSEPTHIRVNHLRAINASQLVLSNECQMSDMSDTLVFVKATGFEHGLNRSPVRASAKVTCSMRDSSCTSTAFIRNATRLIMRRGFFLPPEPR